LRVGSVVLAFHLVWVAAFFATGHEIRDLIRIGTDFVTLSDASDRIKFDPQYDYPRNPDERFVGQGYDGQFFYYIALDPPKARHYVDDPGYRYSRILYPLTARALAFGEPDGIPYALLLINLVAVAVGSAALAAWLARRGSSEWWALVYGLFPGLLLSVQRDLSEPLAFGLVAVGVYLFDFGGRRGVWAAALAFGLAGLARETTLVFPLLFGLSIFGGRPNASGVALAERHRVRATTGFIALALALPAAWAAVRLAWLDSLGHTHARITLVPLGGLLERSWELSRQPVELLLVALPALLWTVAALLGRTRDGTLERACLVANVALALVFAGQLVWQTYTGVGRAAAGVVLAALLCLPYVRREDPAIRRSLTLAAALWLVLIPVVFVYGLTDFRV
jgi:hypothetical protein